MQIRGNVSDYAETSLCDNDTSRISNGSGSYKSEFFTSFAHYFLYRLIRRGKMIVAYYYPFAIIVECGARNTVASLRSSCIFDIIESGYPTPPNFSPTQNQFPRSVMHTSSIVLPASCSLSIYSPKVLGIPLHAQYPCPSKMRYPQLSVMTPFLHVLVFSR